MLVEVIEGDGDNIVILRIENELGVRIKKNWIVIIVLKILLSIYMICEIVKN